MLLSVGRNRDLCCPGYPHTYTRCAGKPSDQRVRNARGENGKTTGLADAPKICCLGIVRNMASATSSFLVTERTVA